MSFIQLVHKISAFKLDLNLALDCFFFFFSSPATLQNLSESKTSARSLVLLVYWGFSSSAPLRLDFGDVCVSVNILLSRKLKWQMQDNDIFWVMEESADKSQFVSVFFVAASYLKTSGSTFSALPL